MAAASAVGVGALVDAVPVAEASVRHAAAVPATTGYTVIYVDSLNKSTPDVAPEADSTTTSSTDAAPQLPTPHVSGKTLGDGAQAAQTNLVCSLATIDLITGVVTALPAAPSPEACAGDLAFAPDGTLYGLLAGESNGDDISELVRFDTATGAATVVGQIGTFLSVGGFGEAPQGGITFDRLGRLFVEVGAAPDDGFDPQCGTGGRIAFCLYRIADPAQPQNATFVGQTITDEYVSGLASSCDATYLQHTVDQFDTAVVGTLDLETAVPTQIGTVSRYFVMGLDFDAAGKFWGIHIGTDDDLTVDSINTAGGDPINSTLVPITDAPEDLFAPEALAIEPLQCVVSAPITFTG